MTLLTMRLLNYTAGLLSIVLVLRIRERRQREEGRREAERYARQVFREILEETTAIEKENE